MPSLVADSHATYRAASKALDEAYEAYAMYEDDEADEACAKAYEAFCAAYETLEASYASYDRIANLMAPHSLT